MNPSNGVSTSSQRPAGRALGDRLQLGLGEHSHQVVPELASAVEIERDALLRQCGAQLRHPPGQLQRVGHEVPAHVGGDHHRAGARGHRGPGELEALAHVARPVVHAGEQVKVNIRCIHGGSTFGSHGPGSGDRSVKRALRVGEWQRTASWRLAYSAAMRPAPTVRLAGVIAPAALVLHELRYLIGFGDHAHEALADRGHAYLPLAGGVAGLLIALAVAQLIVALGRARRTARGEEPPGLLRIWGVLVLALLAVYTGQELLEAALTPGREISAAAVLAEGGWCALPLALVIGALAALVVQGAGRRVAMVARQARPHPARESTLVTEAPSGARARGGAGHRPPSRGSRPARSASGRLVRMRRAERAVLERSTQTCQADSACSL